MPEPGRRLRPVWPWDPSGPRTNVQYRPRRPCRHREPMVTPTRQRRRRTLRQCTPDLLTEATVTRLEERQTVTLEITGGLPFSTATVLVGGSVAGHLRLDGCGSGQVDVRTPCGADRIDIAIDERVLLSGRLPDIVATGRSRP